MSAHEDQNLSARSASHSNSEANEMEFRDVLLFFWSARGYLLIGVLLALVLAVTAILALRVGQYESETQYVIEFRFDGRENDRYPNGTPFSLSDIVAPAVLGQVFERENISQYGLSYADFVSSVLISPYAPDRQKIIDQFSQFDTRKATLAEFNEAQQKLNKSLVEASKRLAVVSFVSGGFSIPQAKINEILVAVVKAWEQNAIEVRGVIKVDLKTTQPAIFDVTNFAGLEKLNALRYLRHKIDDLRAFVQGIASLPGGQLVVDTGSGFSPAGLLSAIDGSSLKLVEAPTAWAGALRKDHSETLGMPVNLYSDKLFDPAQAEQLDYLIAIDLVRERIRLMRSNVDIIANQKYGDVVTDPDSGLIIQDVRKLLDDLDEYSVKQLTAPVLALGIAKNPDVVRLYYNSRLQELRREKQTLSSKATILAQANENYRGLMSSVAPGSNASSNNIAPSTSTVIPQFGDSFLDRIIDLSQKGDDTQFRQDLLQKTVSMQESEADINEEVTRISEYISSFGKAEGNNVSSTSMSFFIERLNEELPAAFTKLKEYAKITERIAYRLRYAEDIFAVAVGNGDGAQSLVNTDFYLRTVAVPASDQLPNIASELKNYAVIANRLYSNIGSDALGVYETLFRPADMPTPVPQPMISIFALLVLVLAVAIGALVSLCVALFRLKIISR